MEEKQTLATLKPYKPGLALEDVAVNDKERVLKLASNENPFGCSKNILAAGTQFLNQLQLYPDGASRKLTGAIAKFHHVEASQVLIGSGLDDVIQIISTAILEEGDEIIEGDPTFSQYHLHATIIGANVRAIPIDKRSGLLNLTAMRQVINDKTKIIWLCNPNNPTGTYLPKKAILEFLCQVPKEVLVVVDEAYQEYVSDEADSSCISLTAEFPNLIVLRTFSKVYGLANLRVGYAVASPQVPMRPFQIVRLPFNVNGIAQKAACIALEDQEFVKKTALVTALERQKWEDFLQTLGYEYYHSQTNFIFFKLPIDDQIVAERLLEEGIIVRAGLQQNWLRVTIGYPSDNQRVREVLQNSLT